MAFDNPSFESLDGGNVGLPLDWTLSATAGLTFAAYDGETVAWEDFDGWVPGYRLDLAVAFTVAPYSAGIFVTPKLSEDFEIGWAPDQAFYTEIGATTAAAFGVGLEPFETFESGWSTETWSDSLAGALTSGVVDSFESGWMPTPYSSSLAVSTTAAMVDGGANAFESFDNVFVPRIFTAAPSTLTSVGHSISNGKRVLLRTTGRLPDGLSIDNYYFVVNASANTLQLSSTSGGAALTFAGTGVGTHTIVSDGVTDWNLQDI